MKHRDEKRNEYIKELISEFLHKESNGASLVTLTRYEAVDYGDTATFFISVLPESQEAAVIDFITRNLSPIRSFVMKHIPSGRIPFLSVAIDEGEKLRRKIDSLQ